MQDEYNLPLSLQEAITKYKIGKEKYTIGNYNEFDMDIDELNSCINSAEICKEISEEQAWRLRNKYLGVYKEW